MLVEALVHQRLQRLERNANHAVFVALNRVVARALLSGRQNHREQQQEQQHEERRNADHRRLDDKFAHVHGRDPARDHIKGDFPDKQRDHTGGAAQRDQRAQQNQNPIPYRMFQTVFPPLCLS